jgi:hypothetical protein
MIIIAYIWIFFLILSTVFIISAVAIDKNFDESHPIKKWWRANVIDWDPNEKRDKPE